MPSSSLIPDDPSVLLTTAGMQQFKPYYPGEADPYRSPHYTLGGKPLGSQRAASCQRSFRTSDIDEVGDERHLTFFEMLGNFSFGPPDSDNPRDFGKSGYFKRSAITWAHELITKEFGLKIDYVSIFKGEGEVPRDEGSALIWKEIASNIEIKEFDRADNFWGPTGNEGPCGPTTEIYVNGVEIWNIVFNEYYQHPDGRLEKLKAPGVDTGMGLERLAMVAQGKKNIFETDLFKDIIDMLPTAWTDMKIKRILADHARGIVFLVSDGVRPFNKDQGYILRKLIRRSIVHLYLKQGTSFSGSDTLPQGEWNDFMAMIEKAIEIYKNTYPEIDRKSILEVLEDERKRFGNAYKNGTRKMKKLAVIDAASAFKLYESYGLPYESIKEIGGSKSASLSREDFDEEFKKHQEISRAGKEAKFGGHGIYLKTGEVTVRDESELEKVTRLHTATHLLHAALRVILGAQVQQDGSDITVERARFDFRFSRKLGPEEIKSVEDLVNQKVKEDLAVTKEQMSYQRAIESGALAFFKEKYPETVTVYSIAEPPNGAKGENEDLSSLTGPSPDARKVFSKEICGGPHVKRTSELGHFKIVKEESCAAGTRRIRAVVE